MMNKKETTISFAIWSLRQEWVISFVLLLFMENEQCISASLQECMGECRSWKGSSETQLLKVLGCLLVYTWHRAFPLLVCWLENLALVCPGFASDNGATEELTDECVWKQTQGRRLNFGADEPLSLGI